MSLSPFVSSQSRFVTYLLTFSLNTTMDKLTTFTNNTDSEHQFTEKDKISNVSGVPRIFFREGVQQIQLRTERTGIWGAVVP